MQEIVDKSVKDVISNSIHSNQVLQNDRKGYIEVIEELTQEKTQQENEKCAMQDELIKLKLKSDSIEWLYKKTITDLEYFTDFAKRVKAAIYEIDIVSIECLSISSLDHLNNALLELLTNLRSFQSQDTSDLLSENLRLKECINEMTEKYADLLSQKSSKITDLEAALSVAESKLSPSAISEHPAYISLVASSAKEKESFTQLQSEREEELSVLKQKLLDLEAQSAKDASFSAKLRSDNVKLFKQNKALKTLEEEKKQWGEAKAGFEQKIAEMQEMGDGLKEQEEVGEAREKVKELEGDLEKVRKEMEEVIAEKRKIEERVVEAEEKVRVAGERVKEVEERAKESENQAQKKVQEIEREKMISKRAIIALKKARMVVERVKEKNEQVEKKEQKDAAERKEEIENKEKTEQKEVKEVKDVKEIPVFVPKPSKMVIKRKRNAKDENKQEVDQIPEKLQKTE
uniref:Uncharacterized protein n=1 Tax=Euplotes harpa TaxID=151035 RepID=A0A7S3NFY0_9SPIT|mmetsp:Transcript_8704/g.9890  ORF Transcript_8704/g.9890 Transcript_8704/m.9890 type:complete len:459 (+) Transcript_8704:916-2292(+)